MGKIQNEGVKRAEVAAWFKNYDEAEKLYLDADMRMLAVRMRKRLGDWFKVVQLLKTGTGGNDTEIEEAYNEVQFVLNSNNSLIVKLLSNFRHNIALFSLVQIRSFSRAFLQYSFIFLSLNRLAIILPSVTNGKRQSNITRRLATPKSWSNVTTSWKITQVWRT